MEKENKQNSVLTIRESKNRSNNDKQASFLRAGKSQIYLCATKICYWYWYLLSIYMLAEVYRNHGAEETKR